VPNLQSVANRSGPIGN